jgi:hypothetical protein
MGPTDSALLGLGLEVTGELAWLLSQAAKVNNKKKTTGIFIGSSTSKTTAILKR